MSMDFGLEPKKNISYAQLKDALGDEYNILDYSEKKAKSLEYFILSPKKNSRYKLEFQKQANGKFWFYTYDYEEDSLRYFTSLAADIANKLGTTVYDYQSNTSKITPEEFKKVERLNEHATALKIARNLPIEKILRTFKDTKG